METKLLNKNKNRMMGPILVLMVLIAAALIYFQSLSDARVDPSGVVIRYDTPENTVKTYYELIYNNRYQPAADLQTGESKKTLRASDLEEGYKQVKINSARLAKVFDGVIQGNLAVVGDVRLVRFVGNSFDSAIVGITVLTNKKDGKRWEIVNSLQEVGEDNYLTLLEMLVKADKKMKNTELARDGFTDVQIRMITQQLDGMLKFHQEQLEEYRKYLRDSRNKQEPASNPLGK